MDCRDRAHVAADVKVLRKLAQDRGHRGSMAFFCRASTGLGKHFLHASLADALGVSDFDAYVDAAVAWAEAHDLEDVDGTVPVNVVWICSEWQVCPTCRGEGKVVDPNIDRNGITPEDFANDPSFEEAYFGGTYDIACPECEGRRVVAVAQSSDPALQAVLREAAADAAAEEAERDAEWRMYRLECGIYD